MIEFPDRIAKLITRIESGESVTQQDVDQIADLQLLDLAKVGEDFARQRILSDHELTEQFKEL